MIWNNITARTLKSVATLCCLPLLAHAAPLSISVEPSDADKRLVSTIRWQVFLEGDIDSGAADRVGQELTQIGDDKADVYLDSPGGSLIDGLRIGRLLRRLGANTILGKRAARNSEIEPGVCLSACSLAFLGGVRRDVPKGSVFGVHRVSTPVHSEQDFDAGQIVAAQVSSYIREMGIDSSLFDRMASTDKDRIYILGAAELRALRVVEDGKQPARWSSRLTNHGQSLTGTQQTAEGTERAILNCDKGNVEFHSIYQAGTNAAMIASGQWVHSLLIDDIVLPLEAPTAIEEVDGSLNATFTLSRDQVRRIAGASAIGHSMQGIRSDPASLGYKIDIDAGAEKTVREFVESCTGFR